ncbi:hypothetical protein GCM10010329_73970 [Streptomyces spiroverticillatus]|uniref:Uncharacterized protein n=1 Tax=Streptomyces finlayi TaxID=67296 RepID=A0A919CFF4_9ACTN|nr:hypothetical protein [Streptomyces finlayi]GHA40144.1 hypothetical protein GCM10010329_73970 [Streptomyces spiroverticillatus]GHD15671.1 hypothetical protein GCM10010334_76100 [Streptomyces finlayi]
MARHRRPLPAPGAALAHRARRQVAAGLFGVSALAATVLAAVVEPAAPPAPDRAPSGPAATASDLAQVSEK